MTLGALLLVAGLLVWATHVAGMHKRQARRDTAEWKKAARRSSHCREIRRQHLVLDGPYCADCGRERDPTELDLDHKFESSYWNETLENTWILCRSCHQHHTALRR